MVAWVLPRVAEVMVGADGTAAGVTALDGSDSAPPPTPFVSETLKV